MAIDWDKYSLKINGERVFLIGGEFHYWRLPDKERWDYILKSYKGAGLNCVRIYFHWGFHNPAEDVFIFHGNRDINYLLKLCEEIGLYVFVAAGPYICAETNAGGFPTWMIQKQNVRVRHMKSTLHQEYDPKYMEYCKKWYEKFIPEIKAHQLTENNPDGCIIGFQIENEYPEKAYGIKSLPRYMEELKQYAEEFGIVVPIYHNDFIELGSWNGLVDLYGYDKYVIFADKHPKSLPLKSWSPKSFMKAVDSSEKKIRELGPPASNGPLFIPELQGGWYNHWTILYGYDELYTYFGPTYQKVLCQSFLAQGVTAMSLYMFYGGTNYGSIGNPEVYTSYDYSACIREYGYQSDRMRHFRLFSLFTRSFNDSLTETNPIDKIDIYCSQKDILYKQRRSLNGTDFYFFRNFNEHKQEFTIELDDGTVVPKLQKQHLEYKDGFIAVGNHKLNENFTIKFCSLPIILKSKFRDGTLLVVYQNGGELILEGTGFRSKYINQIEAENFTRFWFVNRGYDTITSDTGHKLYIVCLDEDHALSFNSNLSDSNFRGMWGAYSSFFQNNGSVEIEIFKNEETVLLCEKDEVPLFQSTSLYNIPGVHTSRFDDNPQVSITSLKGWKKKKTQWEYIDDSEIWRPIIIEAHDPLNYGFTSGHILYKCEFTPKSYNNLQLKLNARHKAAIWLNGSFVGGLANYTAKTQSVFKPGPMNGPDLKFLGAKTFDLTPYLTHDKNVLFIITESLGQSKHFFPTNDSKNPRGILNAKFSKQVLNKRWYISGINVTNLSDPFDTAGLPGEKRNYHINSNGNDWKSVGTWKILPEDQIVWYSTTFGLDLIKNERIPLRVHIEGKHNCSIYLNGHCIGRYWGGAGPQNDFYLMDSLLRVKNTLTLACWTSIPDEIKIVIEPYNIDSNSGNIKKNGKPRDVEIFKTKTKEIFF
ncbi:MAG: beta-galactosidase [Candidatus Lokiarchaeota archaeon]|nr:beta-galactosidase [Candidatus Lokiarchaeota archaeon]